MLLNAVGVDTSNEFKEIAVGRPIRIVIVACALLVASVTPAVASTPQPVSAGALSALWYKVLTLPSPENPFGDGGVAKTCVQIAPRLLSPFGPGEVPSCTVPRGTTLVVTPWTTECSTFETPGKTPAELRQCAEEADAGVTNISVTVDGKSVNTDEVTTPVLTMRLPADNIFGLPKNTWGQSVGHGWVSILKPMAPGKHVINVKSTGSSGGMIDNTTEIIVQRR